VWNPYPKPRESVKWLGKCINGKAQGYGTLEWYQDGIRTASDIFKKNAGTLLRNGKIVSVIDVSNVTLSIEECKKNRRNKGYFDSYRVIRADVSTQIDLSHSSAVNEVLSMVQKYAWSKCPAKSFFSPKKDVFSNVKAKLYLDGELVVSASSSASTIDGTGEPSWGRYENKIKDRINKENKKRVIEEKKKIREQKKREAAKERQRKIQAKKEKERRQKEEAINRFNAFSKKNDVNGWPSVEELSINPFIYERQVVGLKLKFNKMLSATKGIFGDGVVVSNIPKGLFRSKARVVLAGKVLGNTTIKTRFGGEEILPHLKYIDAYFCKTWSCSGIIIAK